CPAVKTAFALAVFTVLAEHCHRPFRRSVKYTLPVVVAGALKKLPVHGVPIAPTSGRTAAGACDVDFGAVPGIRPAGPCGCACAWAARAVAGVTATESRLLADLMRAGVQYAVALAAIACADLPLASGEWLVVAVVGAGWAAAGEATPSVMAVAA